MKLIDTMVQLVKNAVRSVVKFFSPTPAPAPEPTPVPENVPSPLVVGVQLPGRRPGVTRPRRS